MNTNAKKIKTTVIMGLALFATQFGAGNLIFPPFLGRDTGSAWWMGFLGFFIMDVGLAAASVYSVVANRKGTVDGVVGKMGRIPGVMMVTTIILCLGPIVCIPRTAATSYAMGIHQLVPVLPQWAFSAIFFSIVLLFVIRPTKVVDIIGNYLTPILLAVMVLLIVLGIVNPIDTPATFENIEPLHDGILNGYQTLDGIGGILMTMMLITAAQSHGYKNKKEVKGIIAGADIISACLLAFVYGGLTYLGSTVSGLAEYAELGQAPLLIAITNKLLGGYGVIALAIIVLMACLTTAIGLSSVMGNYFEELTHGKVKYQQIVVAVIAFSFAMSNIGLDNIISFAAPVLAILYPPIIVLVLMAFTDKFIKNDRVGGFAAYAALIASIIDTLGLFGLSGVMAMLPFANSGLGWITPAIAGGVIGFIFKDKNFHVEETVHHIEEEIQAEIEHLEEELHHGKQDPQAL